MRRMAPAGQGRDWRGIRGKLFLSYLFVAAAGLVTLFAGVSYLAPTFFDQSMMGMMGGSAGMTGMMGAMGQGQQGARQLLNADVVNGFHQAVTSSLLVAGGAALVAAILASYLFTLRVVEPVRQMVRATRRIAGGHYDERVASGGDDELAELGDSFNQMAVSLEDTERRRLVLVGDVAHELRTPLSTIEGYAEGLLDGVVEGTPETFALIHREAGRLRRLVDDLQELSRAEARQLSLHLQALAPKQLVDGAMSRMRSQFADKGILVEVSVPEVLPEVRADEDRTLQVLTNLLGNALRYTPGGGKVTIRADRAGQFVEFSVADTGVGIAPDQLAHVFERFYRVDHSRSRSVGGSGIGLTIAWHIVEAQGGIIRATSAGAGLGATFSFTLPTVR